MIREQLGALARQCDCVVLTGEPPSEHEEPDLAVGVRVVEELGYDEPGQGSAGPRAAAAAIRRAMIDEWGTVADVLHVHNPLLRKNSSLLPALRILQDEGIALFLQVHDLAEDGRPSAYDRRAEYPVDCHYGVVNSRDRLALLGSGLVPEGLHLLFNVVRPIGCGPIEAPGLPSGARPRLVYPVRGIRRKNIGEALLLGLLLDAEVSMTLPPRDPADLEIYEEWKAFARGRGMRASFDVGLARGLRQVMAESTAAVTTSVKEGFGFAYLEPWTAGRAATGRRIDAVCGDFEKEGLRLPHLYSSLEVPVALFGCSGFRARWEASLAAAFRSFGRSTDGRTVERAFSAMTREGFIDFASLDERAQREVIDRASGKEAAVSRQIETVNPGLGLIRNALASPDASLAEANRSTIIARYEPGRYAEVLGGIYRAVLEKPVRQSIDRAALLDRFLSHERFRMIEQRDNAP